MNPGTSFSWHHLLRYSHVWVTLLKWPASFVIGWAAIYYRRWQKTRQETTAQGWPSVEGIIIGGKVTPIPKTARFHVTLNYTYFVEEYRTGKYSHDFANESEADDFVRQLKDKRIQIRYKQSNPNKSVLEQSVIEQHVLLAPRFS
jgi:hypothetical protein